MIIIASIRATDMGAVSAGGGEEIILFLWALKNESQLNHIRGKKLKDSSKMSQLLEKMTSSFW